MKVSETIAVRPGAKFELLARMLSEALREIGILLIAFAPLDWGISSPRPALWIVTSFMSVGFILVAAGMAIEWRYSDA